MFYVSIVNLSLLTGTFLLVNVDESISFGFTIQTLTLLYTGTALTHCVLARHSLVLIFD